MKSKTIKTLALLAAIIISVTGQAYAQNQDLMREAQIQRLITSIELKDYSKSFELIEDLRRSGTRIRGELLYYEALSALAIGNNLVAYKQSEAYIKESGRDGKFYSAALEIYATAAENWDAMNMVASFTHFNDAKLQMMYHRFSNSHADLVEEQKKRFFIWRNSYTNNNNGTISTYSVNKKNDGTYNLIRLDWLACPIGTTYVDPYQPCQGEVRKVKHQDSPQVARALSFLGFDDWRLPHELHVSFDRSHKMVATGDISISTLRARSPSLRTSLLNQSHPLPHFHSFPGADYATHGFPLHIREHHRTPCSVIGSTLYCEHGEYDNPYYGTVIPIRGPYIVKQSSKVNCHETDLAKRGRSITYAGRLRTPSNTLCEFDDQPGVFYFLNDFYGANTFDPTSKKTTAPESEESSSPPAEATAVEQQASVAIHRDADSDRKGSAAEPAQADSSRDEMTMGEVIIYRSKRSLNSDVDYLVSWQGKPQGVVRNGGVLKMRLPAGPQVLHFTNFRPGSYELQESLTVSAQTETYLFMRLHLSLSARSQMSIEPVSAEQGRAAVMDSLN